MLTKNILSSDLQGSLDGCTMKMHLITSTRYTYLTREVGKRLNIHLVEKMKDMIKGCVET